MNTNQQVDPLIGRLVDGRYRVRARIARGGMATVYVATDLRLERRVALKVMHSHLSDDTVFQSRFIQEARAAARLADPNVVNVFDQGQDGEMAYLVMEYLPGITLRELLREQRRLSIPQTVTIMDAILSGLSAAHRAGIIHRDVKPENVLLAEDGRIKIGDFGLARATSANTATGAQLLGTIAYLAPELVTRGSADARSDIYALGILLYEMLTGEQPYQGEQPMQIAYQHATDSVPRPSAKNPSVPDELDELVLWATEKNPDERISDAEAMLERLREIERELGITPQISRANSPSRSEDDRLSSDDLTHVIAPAHTGPTSTVHGEGLDNAAALRAVTKRRKRKGAWLLTLIVTLAVLAAGSGWWFGSGPGSLISVPNVAASTFEQAQATLDEQTLTAVRQDENSQEVETGRIIRTDPAAGARVEKESSVTIFVSAGPAQVQVPRVVDAAQADARSTLTDLDLLVAEEPLQYFTDAPRDTVVDAVVTPAAGGDNIGCGDGCTALQGDTVTLSVSLGRVPDVVGLSFKSASENLADQGLQVASPAAEEPNDEFSDGDVIRMEPKPDGGWWAPGDTVTLVVSTGPPLFEVPDVTDLTRDEAEAVLTDAGFTVQYADFLGPPFPDFFTRATGTDPAAGELREKGSSVYIRLTASS